MGAVLEAKQRKSLQRFKVGKVIMFIGCILLFVNAISNLFDFVLALIYPNLPDSDFKEVLAPTFEGVWSQPISFFKYAFRPFIAAFLILSGIGGIQWIRDKGRLMSLAPLMAIISLVLIVANIFLDIRTLVMSNWNWGLFFLSILDLQFTCGIYFVGWFLAKGHIDE